MVTSSNFNSEIVSLADVNDPATTRFRKIFNSSMKKTILMQTSFLKSEKIQYAVDCYLNYTLFKNFTSAWHLNIRIQKLWNGLKYGETRNCVSS